jgi:hypothetical protein
MMTDLTNLPKKGWVVISISEFMLYADCTCLRSEKFRVANGLLAIAQRCLLARRKAGKFSEPAKSTTAESISGGMLGSERPWSPLRGS